MKLHCGIAIAYCGRGAAVDFLERFIDCTGHAPIIHEILLVYHSFLITVIQDISKPSAFKVFSLSSDSGCLIRIT